jgi:hypothetical protein
MRDQRLGRARRKDEAHDLTLSGDAARCVPAPCSSRSWRAAMRLQEYKRTVASVTASVVALGLAANMATPALSQTPDPRDRMKIWVGRWDDVGEVKETIYSHAARVHKRVSCVMTGDRGYVVCEYLDVAADLPKDEDVTDNLSVYAYDDKTHTYRHFGVSNYKMSEHPQVTLDGKIWSYTYQETGKGGDKVDVRISYEFVTAEKRVIHIEASSDGGQHWILVVDEVETKIS